MWRLRCTRAPARQPRDTALEAAQLERARHVVCTVEGPVQDPRDEDAGRSAEVGDANVASAGDQRTVGLAGVLSDSVRVASQDHEERDRRARQAEALEHRDDAAPARDHAEDDGGR